MRSRAAIAPRWAVLLVLPCARILRAVSGAKFAGERWRGFRALRLRGSGGFQNTVSEDGLNEITGDGVAELLPNAVTILIGGAAVATQAASFV